MKRYANKDTGRSTYFDRSVSMWILIENGSEPDYTTSFNYALDWIMCQARLRIEGESKMKPYRKNLMTRKQVALKLDINERTLDRWRKVGLFDVEPVKLNSRVLFFRREDVEAWMKDRA